MGGAAYGCAGAYDRAGCAAVRGGERGADADSGSVCRRGRRVFTLFSYCLLLIYDCFRLVLHSFDTVLCSVQAPTAG